MPVSPWLGKPVQRERRRRTGPAGEQGLLELLDRTGPRSGLGVAELCGLLDGAAEGVQAEGGSQCLRTRGGVRAGPEGRQDARKVVGALPKRSRLGLPALLLEPLHALPDAVGELLALGSLRELPEEGAL